MVVGGDLDKSSFDFDISSCLVNCTMKYLLMTNCSDNTTFVMWIFQWYSHRALTIFGYMWSINRNFKIPFKKKSTAHVPFLSRKGHYAQWQNRDITGKTGLGMNPGEQAAVPRTNTKIVNNPKASIALILYNCTKWNSFNLLGFSKRCFSGHWKPKSLTKRRFFTASTWWMMHMTKTVGPPDFEKPPITQFHSKSNPLHSKPFFFSTTNFLIIQIL